MATAEYFQQRSFRETMRRDRWWVQPLLIFLGLSAFIVYTTWAAFQGHHYFYSGDGAEYLSPFYSPLLYGQPGEPRWIAAPRPSWWPASLPFSAAFLILMGPAGMRFTCYYYRGSYYKAFWADPPACAVGEPRKIYRGEAKLPLNFQNLHRFFFYPAAAFVLILAYDAYRAMWFIGSDGTHHFGIGVGTLVLAINAILLGGYTFGCHCARHMIGGYLDSFSKSKVRKCGYQCVSALNNRHSLWAWMSLCWVLFSDVYVRLCAMGVWHDWRIF